MGDSYFALVAHTHLPYVRRNGTWPCGEDFFHQAATESYLPLIAALERLTARGIREFATIGVTPVLAEQMTDPHLQQELSWFLGSVEPRAMRQVANFRGHHAAHIKAAAAMYAMRARGAWQDLSRMRLDIASGLTRAARDAGVELLAGPATHPLLSRIDSPALLDAQLQTGLQTHKRIFGAAADGIWIPECAVAAGLGDALARSGVQHAVVDPAAISGGARPVFAGSSGVAVIPIDWDATRLVWGPNVGYPAGEWYRDFHTYDLVAGFKNWRITGRDTGPLGKEPYDPDRARLAALADADAFVARLEEMFATRESIVACFDTELFGHWWLEGPMWLEAVIERLHAHPTIQPVTLKRLLEAQPPTDHMELESSTWGDGAGYSSWETPATEPMWKRLSEAEQVTEALLRRVEPGRAARLLLRELFLLQSSDWTFMVARNDNAAYATQRFDAHLQRWATIAQAMERGKDPSEDLNAIEPIDSIPSQIWWGGLPIGS